MCDSSLGPLFDSCPMFTYRCATTPQKKKKNGENLLASWKKSVGTFRCGGCNHCTHINWTTTFMNSVHNETYKCCSFINCNSTFVVYCLDCDCGRFYIGRTKRKLKERSQQGARSLPFPVTGTDNVFCIMLFSWIHVFFNKVYPLILLCFTVCLVTIGGLAS